MCSCVSPSHQRQEFSKHLDRTDQELGRTPPQDRGARRQLSAHLHYLGTQTFCLVGHHDHESALCDAGREGVECRQFSFEK